MKKVLVIDDSKTIRTLCEWIYKGLDDVVLTAANEEEARQLIERESPDVICVDYTMPGQDAYAFLSSLRDSGAGLVMLGGEYAPFDVDKALASGAIEVLMKPFRTTDFFECIDRVALSPKRQAAAVETVSAPSVAAQEQTPSPAERPAARSGSQPIIGLPKGSGAFPPITPKRFNFPGTGSSPQNVAVTPPPHSSQNETPAHVQSGLRPSVVSSPMYQRPAEQATPRTPVPSISPAISHFQSQTQSQPQIDPNVLRAEVIAAVKSMLPAIVNSYLKKLIQAEVKPQLQHWVDARVEALIKK